MTERGNGEKPEQVSIFPSKMFTDLEDPESRERFKALMKFQYGFSDEQLVHGIEILIQQEKWKAEANFYLLEITDCEHEYFGRIGQVMFAMGGAFIGNRPSYKVDAKELLAQAQVNVEHKLCLVVKIDLNLVELREDGKQFRLINKFELKSEDIEVETEEGLVGKVVSWRKNEKKRLPLGFYTLKFGERVIEVPDFLMMQEPTYPFRRAGIQK